MKKGTILKTAFNEYEIIEQIGQGGCGIVYKCQCYGVYFAVKTINKNKGIDKIKRFKNEINFCQMNNGPYIIHVSDFGYYQDDSSEYLFYVMPYYQQNLRKMMNQHLSPEKAIELFLNICSGLKEAHKNNCIHRDIKPENILINELGEAIISDFGIAHFEELNKITTIETTDSSRLANFSYHAPEQINNSSLTPATDIFALGLILNEMFTGQIPLGDSYKKIEEVNKDYIFLDKIVSKMICQNAVNRYQTIDELLIDYRAYSLENSKNKEIANLKIPPENIEIKDDLFLHPPVPKDIKIDNGNLIITLSNSVNSSWIDFFRESLNSHTISPFCYQDFRFSGHIASYHVEKYGCILAEHSIKKLVEEFKEACKITNTKYQSFLVSENSKIKNEELKRRKAEIERLEKEKQMNNSLKNML